MAHGNELLKTRMFFLKLPKNWFKNARIKKLRKIAGGDTYTIIYLKLLLLSMNYDNHIIFEEIEPTLEEELALKLDEDADNIKLTISFLKANNLWEEVSDTEYHLIEADGMTGSESYANVLRKDRVGLKKIKPSLNQTLTIKDKDKDKEIEKDIEIENIIEKIDKKERMV